MNTDEKLQATLDWARLIEARLTQQLQDEQEAHAETKRLLHEATEQAATYKASSDDLARTCLKVFERLAHTQKV